MKNILFTFLFIIAYFIWIIFTGSQFDLWICILFIFLIWSYHDIVFSIIRIWNLFFRQYNNAYPAFTRYEIGTDWNRITHYSVLSANIYEKFDKLVENESKNGVKRNQDYSEKVKDYYKKYLAAEYSRNFWNEVANYKIEANIAVNNGKKKIEDVQSYAYKYAVMPHWENGIETSKKYKEWIEQK